MIIEDIPPCPILKNANVSGVRKLLACSDNDIWPFDNSLIL